MPRLQIDGEGSRTLNVGKYVDSVSPLNYFSSLIDVGRGCIEVFKHWKETSGNTRSSIDFRSGSSNVVDINANSPAKLRDQGTTLQGFVNSIDRVINHREKVARGELGTRSSTVEQCGSCMCEPAFRHQVVGLNDTISLQSLKYLDRTTTFPQKHSIQFACLNCGLNVVFMNSDGNTHNHELRTLDDLPVDSQ